MQPPCSQPALSADLPNLGGRLTAPAGPQDDASHLRRRTITSGASALGARTLQGVLLLGTAVALARLLTPEDFGIFAMIVPFGILARNATNQTVQTAMLQSRTVSEPGLNGFFWFIARVNVLVAAALVGAGFVLSLFFSEPRVLGVGVAWAATLLFLVPATFQEALLKRSLRFPVVMAIQLSTLVLGIGCSLAAAWLGAGYWALPIQVLVMELGRAIGLFVLSDWRPGARNVRDEAEESQLRRAWLQLVGLRVTAWLSKLPEVVAIGRVGGAVLLGNYDTARRWASYAFVEPFLALTDVTLASLRHVRDEAGRFEHILNRAFLVMLTASLPIIAFVAVEAETVVLVVLGPQWGDAVPFLQVLSVAAFATSLIRVNRWIYLALGQTGRLLTWSLLIETPLTVLAVLIGLLWGPVGVAKAMATVSVTLIIPAILYTTRGTPLSFGDVLRAVFRPTVASIAAAAVVALSASVLPGEIGALRLVAALGLFGIVFVATWHVMPGGIADTKALLGALPELVRRNTSEAKPDQP